MRAYWAAAAPTQAGARHERIMGAIVEYAQQQRNHPDVTSVCNGYGLHGD